MFLLSRLKYVNEIWLTEVSEQLTRGTWSSHVPVLRTTQIGRVSVSTVDPRVSYTVGHLRLRDKPPTTVNHLHFGQFHHVTLLLIKVQPDRLLLQNTSKGVLVVLNDHLGVQVSRVKIEFLQVVGVGTKGKGASGAGHEVVPQEGDLVDQGVSEDCEVLNLGAEHD